MGGRKIPRAREKVWRVVKRAPVDVVTLTHGILVWIWVLSLPIRSSFFVICFQTSFSTVKIWSNEGEVTRERGKMRRMRGEGVRVVKESRWSS